MFINAFLVQSAVFRFIKEMSVYVRVCLLTSCKFLVDILFDWQCLYTVFQKRHFSLYWIGSSSFSNFWQNYTENLRSPSWLFFPLHLTNASTLPGKTQRHGNCNVSLFTALPDFS